MFPAGSYTVKPLAESNLLPARLLTGAKRSAIATEPIPSAASDPHTAGLIFDEQDGHHHLRELWMNSVIGVEVPGPRGEQLQLVRFSGPRVGSIAGQLHHLPVNPSFSTPVLCACPLRPSAILRFRLPLTTFRIATAVSAARPGVGELL
jgi:hypothetical protein